MKILAVALLLLATTGYAQTQKSKWDKEASKLSMQDRQELSHLTPEPEYSQCRGSTSWNKVQLYWECTFGKGHGPKAILPMEASRAAYKKMQEDAMWCDPTAFGGASDSYHHQYHCVPNDKGPEGRKGRIEEDVKAEQYLAKMERDKEELARALTTRVLTDAEMTEVLRQGPNIFVFVNQPYQEAEIERRYIVALDIQVRIRKLEAKVKGPSPKRQP